MNVDARDRAGPPKFGARLQTDPTRKTGRSAANRVLSASAVIVALARHRTFTSKKQHWKGSNPRNAERSLAVSRVLIFREFDMSKDDNDEQRLKHNDTGGQLGGTKFGQEPGTNGSNPAKPNQKSQPGSEGSRQGSAQDKKDR